jgi:dTDP-4-amino-4,6-dideoxygalactose transaminase
VASGTSALTLAISACGIDRGDEVIVPAHTYIASALAVLHAGATPVFCDVEEATGLIDPESAAEAISERTAAILAVHLYGQTCDMAPLQMLTERHGLLLVEDAAQAHGATYRGRRAGSLGSVAAFSFYPSKNLGALGDGGAVLTRDPDVAQRVRELRNLGQRRKGEHVSAGLNARLDGIQAALLRVKLGHLDVWNAERRGHAAAYRELLPGSLGLLEERPDRSCVYHLFPVRTPERDLLRASLAAAGVGVGVHYSPALHEQPPLAPYAPAHPLPVAEAWASEELSLPMFPQLEPAEVRWVATACAATTPADSEARRYTSVA